MIKEKTTELKEKIEEIVENLRLVDDDVTRDGMAEIAKWAIDSTMIKKDMVELNSFRDAVNVYLKTKAKQLGI